MNEIENYFNKLRFDKNHHLGLGDIRLTIAQQDELVALFKQKLQQHSVMQAEGSDGAQGAAVGNSAAGQSGRVGCVHNTLKYIGPWYSCETCGTNFNARAEAPPEGALPF